MLVRFLGVQLVLGQGLTMADFFAELKKKDGKEFEHRGSHREMHTGKVDSYHVGVIVSVNDRQTLMRRRKEGTTWTVKPDVRQPGQEIVDFNFFALHETTGRGLYQHYRGSLSTPLLSNLLAREHVKLINERREEWRQLNVGNFAPSTLMKKSRDIHKGQLFLRNIVRQEDYKTLIAKLDEVNAFQVDIAGMFDEAKSFQPLKPTVTATRLRVTFNAKVSGNSVVKFITKIMGRDGSTGLTDLDGGRVEGIENGQESIIDFDSLPVSQFASYKYEDVATEFKPHEFTRSYLLKELVRTCTEFKSVFERPGQ